MPSHKSYLNQASGLRTQYETLQKKISTSPATNMKLLHHLAAIYKQLGQYKKSNYFLNILEEICSTYYPYSPRHLHVQSLIIMNKNKVIQEKKNNKKNKERMKEKQKYATEINNKELLKKGKKNENDESNDENEKEA
jgi:hypothetical protein